MCAISGKQYTFLWSYGGWLRNPAPVGPVENGGKQPRLWIIQGDATKCDEVATWEQLYCLQHSWFIIMETKCHLKGGLLQDPALRQVVALKTARIRDAKEHYQAGAAVFVRIPERSTWISLNMPPTKSGLWIETVKSAVWWQSQCCNQAYMRICESLHMYIYIYIYMYIIYIHPPIIDSFWFLSPIVGVWWYQLG